MWHAMLIRSTSLAIKTQQKNIKCYLANMHSMQHEQDIFSDPLNQTLPMLNAANIGQGHSHRNPVKSTSQICQTSVLIPC